MKGSSGNSPHALPILILNLSSSVIIIMENAHGHSPSPSRKLKEIKEIPTLPQFFKTLPVSLPEEIVGVVNSLAPINEAFKGHLATLTVYRANLGLEVEKNWLQILNFSKRLIWQIDSIVKSNSEFIQGNRSSIRILLSTWPRIEREWRSKSES